MAGDEAICSGQKDTLDTMRHIDIYSLAVPYIVLTFYFISLWGLPNIWLKVVIS